LEESEKGNQGFGFDFGGRQRGQKVSVSMQQQWELELCLLLELGVTVTEDKLGELLTEPVSVADSLPMTIEYGGFGVVWGLGIMDGALGKSKGSYVTKCRDGVFSAE
jgi:hypothetical protein